MVLNFHSSKIIVGYDLGNTYSQISFRQAEGGEVETVSAVAGTESYNIPTVLCKRYEVNQWFYGKEAIKQAEEGNGILVKDLIDLAIEGEPIQLEGNAYDPIKLLTLFIKRSLSLLSMVSSPDKISAMMFTCEHMDHRMIEILGQAVEGLRLKAGKIAYQSYMESYYYYMMQQPRELWQSRSVLCDYDRDRIKCYRMECNERTAPVVVYMEEEEYPFLSMGNMPEAENLRMQRLEKMDREFLSIAEKICEGKRISSVYLIGEAYSEEWMKESLRYLCKERRVFQGSNLYSKGACYGMLKRLNKGEEAEHVFLGGEMLKANIGMRVLRRGEASYYALLDAGVNWFEAENTCEFYLKEEREIELVITPLTGKSSKLARITLEGLRGAITRLRMQLFMVEENKLRVEIESLGFGEFIPSSGQIWKEEMEIY